MMLGDSPVLQIIFRSVLFKDMRPRFRPEKREEKPRQVTIITMASHSGISFS